MKSPGRIFLRFALPMLVISLAVAAARRDIGTLAQLPVPGARGPVASGNVASLEIGSGPSEITRLDRTRNVNITVELNGRPLGEIEDAVLALPSLGRLPQGVTRSAGGDAEDMEDLTQGLGSRKFGTSFAAACGCQCSPAFTSE